MAPKQDEDWHRRRASLLVDLARHNLRRARRVRARDLVLEQVREARRAS